MLHREGRWFEKDPEKATALFLAAAEKNYGPALYEVGRMYLEGDRMRRDTDKGLKIVHEAAVLGSAQAQFFLGAAYETGRGAPRDPDRARRYFRLCAAAQQPLCQYRLAKALCELPDRREHDYLQAIAWYQLAADKGIDQAKEALNEEMPKLTAEQLDWVNRLKAQLARKL